MGELALIPSSCILSSCNWHWQVELKGNMMDDYDDSEFEEVSSPPQKAAK